MNLLPIPTILGLAEGASAPFESVLALNVRTEIAYGMFKDDGCTALSWSSDDRAILAQNWDWRPAQKANLIRLTITRPSHTLSMVTEAGILGKIGLNSAGYGVCLNALRVAGVDFAKLPVHLALRKVLDFDQPGQLNKLVSSLQARGIATSAHILIANSENAVGLEATHKDVKVLHERASNTSKILTHTNHLILSHEDIEERLDLPDSQPRLKRINELINAQTKPPNPSSVLEMLKDEEGYPASICRESANQSTSATCFSIIMDLEAKMAACKLGRPNAGGEEFEINFVD